MPGPTPGDVRAQVLLELRAQGQGEGDKLAQEVLRAAGVVGQLKQQFVAGTMAGEEYRATIRGAAGDLKFWIKELNDFDAAMKKQVAAIDALEASMNAMEGVRMQAIQRRMEAERQATAESERREAGRAATAERIARDLDAMKMESIRRRLEEERRAAAEQERLDRRAQSERQRAADDARKIDDRVERDFARQADSRERQAARRAEEIGREVADRERQAAAEDAATDRFIRDKDREIEAEKRKAVALATSVVQTQVQADGTERYFGRVNAQMDQGKTKSEKFSYGLLHVAHAFQDLQYGMGAVLNNIPLVVQAFGGGPGLAGTIMIAGVAAQMLVPHIGSIGEALGLAADKTRAFTITTDDLKERLKALEARAWKVEVDYREIDEARERLKKLREEEASYEAGKKTKPHAALISKAEAAVEAAGGSDAMALHAMQDYKDRGVTHAQESDVIYARNLRRMMPTLHRHVAESSNEVSRFANEQILRYWQSQLDTTQDRIDDADRNAAKQEVGAFRTGDEAAIARFRRLARQRPDRFGRPAARLLEKMPANEIEAANQQLQEQVKEAERHDAAAEQTAHDAEVSRHAGLFGSNKRLGGEAQAAIRRAMAGGERDKKRLMASARPTVEADLRASGTVPEHMIPEVATQLLEKALASEMGELLSGSEVDPVKAAQQKIAADAATAKAKDDKKDAAVARPGQAALRHRAGQLSGEMGPDVELALLRRRGQNQSLAAAGGALTPQVRGRLGAEGPNAGALAEQVVATAMDHARAQLAAAGGDTAANAQRLATQAEGRQVARGRQEQRRGQAPVVEDVANQLQDAVGGGETTDMARRAAQQSIHLAQTGWSQQAALHAGYMSLINQMQALQNQIMQQAGGMHAQIGMAHGRMGQMRTRRPLIPNMIPGGG
jgi:hypothetical protein